MDFIAFITSLAPEGETFLVVKQKPVGKGLQFYADGAIKATWPAMLPEKMRGRGAWYGNTASFIIDRFVDGRVSASAANCEYVLLMLLDDVGDPKKTTKMPPLKPTWIMETSPGSFQWGYVFRIQPAKDEFSAAIAAIAEAGYTDKGAINAVRNFRLPGSVNLKPGKDNFEARLVEFHPERDFTLEEIIKAFDVVPGEVGNSGYRPLRLADDGTDDVLIWLSNNGKLFSRPNHDGWASVECPNAAEHSNGDPIGRYNPTTRSFCCYHAHCTDTIRSAEFLAWVAEQGGPNHKPGLRDELLSQKMSSALAKLTPTDAFPDEAKRVIEEVERKEHGRLEREAWFERFAYLQVDNAFFDMLESRVISRPSFDATFRHVECRSIHNLKLRVQASVSFDELRERKGARILISTTYAAGESPLCTRNGDVYGNRWRDARPPIQRGGDPTRWLEHVAMMIPDEAERNHVLDVMAFKVQNPSIKINHAILHGGKSGSGKDTLWYPFFWAIGGSAQTNVIQIKPEDVNSQWGYALESEVICYQELRPVDAKDRRALENSLKPIIAAPPEFLMVNRKNEHPYQAVNRVLVVAMSNERVAIHLPSEDRRWFVIWSEAEPMPREIGESFWDWLTKEGGREAVAAWLHDRDVSAFSPGARPMMTEAKAIMIESGLSGAESYMVEMMRACVGEFSKGVVGAPWHALCDRLAGGAPAGLKLVQGALLHAFKEAGWIDMGRLASRTHGTKKHIFCAPEMRHLSRSEMRDLVEEPPAPLMVRVK
jgi:hypothetical protein